MEAKLLTQLSNDYIKLFETGEYYDVVLRAGQEPNFKEFRAHSLILRTRSAYFRSALSSNWVETQGNIMLFFKPNVSPEVFEVILNFLYGGTVCLAEHDAKVILDVLKATDEFCIPDLSEYIQDYLLTNPWRLMSHLVLVHKFATEQERYPKIRKCVIELIKENPATIFDSSDFTTMDQNTLLSFFKCQHFFMKPVEIWKRIVEWGIANTPSLPNLRIEWKIEDYYALGLSLKPFIPMIRFYEMSYEEFLREVQPWQTSLDYVDNELYGNIDTNIQLINFNNGPREVDYINSVLITKYDAEVISNWIKNISSLPDNYKHNFKLILRGSQDGFTPKKFHERCDGKGPTLTILREKQSGEILGGYNPLNWYSMVAGNYSPTSSSFIFSLGDKVFYFDHVLSRIIDRNKAIYQNGNYGPCFGGGESDLRLFGNNFNEDIRCRCVQTSYQKKIRNNDDEFCIDEFEVFQVLTSFEN